jgi:hypothetical protein
MTVVQNVKKNTFFFSEHASAQLHSRSQLKRSDVLRLLSDNITIPVGVDKHRLHTVIYSVKDDAPLVIVHDERNGEIVTVLYVEYNNKFVIHPNVLDEIKKMTLEKFNKNKPKESVKEKTEWIQLYPEVRKCPVVQGLIRLYFNVKTGDGFKDVEFITLNSDDFGGDVTQICNMNNIKIKIENGRDRKKVAKLAIVQIFARLETGRIVKLGTSRDYELLNQTELNKALNQKQKNEKNLDK